MATRGRKPHGKVQTKWSAEFAYAVGLITADGSLSKDGRHINFTSKDLVLVKTFQSCLCINDVKICRKNSGTNSQRIYYQVQFSDVLFYRWLMEVGLHPNKSKTLINIKVPSNYFFDFLRGIWDGDGTIYRTKDKRWVNSYVVSIGYSSGSSEFLKWLQSEINLRLHTTGFVSCGAHVLQLRYAYADSVKIFQGMFYQNNLPHLQRKFAKAQKIFRIQELF